MRESKEVRAMNIQRIYNPIIQLLLCSPFHALISKSTALLTVYGHQTGRALTFPVNYVPEGDSLLVITKIEHSWWRNLHKPADLLIRLEGQEMIGTGQVVEDRTTLFKYAKAMLRAHRNLERLLGVAVNADGHINDPEKLLRSLSGFVIVRIDSIRARHVPATRLHSSPQ